MKTTTAGYLVMVWLEATPLRPGRWVPDGEDPFHLSKDGALHDSMSRTASEALQLRKSGQSPKRRTIARVTVLDADSV